eukprot:5861349-Karenia_brevis.AAC.1
MFGTRKWGSPLNDESDSAGKLLQTVPAFPEGGERKESSKEEDRSEEALAPNWLRGGINTSSTKRVLTSTQPVCQSPGLGIPGNHRGCHEEDMQSACGERPGLGIPGNQRGCHVQQLYCPQLLALTAPPLEGESENVGPIGAKQRRQGFAETLLSGEMMGPIVAKQSGRVDGFSSGRTPAIISKLQKTLHQRAVDDL